MLDQLLGLIQENAQEAVVNNPAVPNQQNSDVMQSLLSSITGGFQQQAQAGNLAGILGLLSGKEVEGGNVMANPVASGIADSAVGNLMQQFGFQSNVASSIVGSVLPQVIGALIGGRSGQGGFDTGSLLSGLLGGGNSGQGGFDLGGQLSAAMADGKLDMNDLMRVGGSLLSGQGGGGGQQQGGMDLGGLLGGLFGGR